MRECKKRKIPAIFVRIENKDELFSVPWGWIKEAMFPYNSPLIPIFQVEKDNSELKQTWQMVMSKKRFLLLQMKSLRNSLYLRAFWQKSVYTQ